MKAGNQTDLLALVEFQAGAFGKHDRWYMRNKRGAHDLTHDGSGPVA